MGRHVADVDRGRVVATARPIVEVIATELGLAVGIPLQGDIPRVDDVRGKDESEQDPEDPSESGLAIASQIPLTEHRATPSMRRDARCDN